MYVPSLRYTVPSLRYTRGLSLRYTRGLGWRMHCGAEVTESSTNKQHPLSKVTQQSEEPQDIVGEFAHYILRSQCPGTFPTQSDNGEKPEPDIWCSWASSRPRTLPMHRDDRKYVGELVAGIRAFSQCPRTFFLIGHFFSWNKGLQLVPEDMFFFGQCPKTYFCLPYVVPKENTFENVFSLGGLKRKNCA